MIHFRFRYCHYAIATLFSIRHAISFRRHSLIIRLFRFLHYYFFAFIITLADAADIIDIADAISIISIIDYFRHYATPLLIFISMPPYAIAIADYAIIDAIDAADISIFTPPFHFQTLFHYCFHFISHC
jgi:hypothetical protein